MSDSFWLVIAGGLIGFVSSLVPLVLRRWWDREDRRRADDARALDAAVTKLMAWQDYAVTALGSGELQTVPGTYRERPDAMERMDQLMRLLDRVILSAQQKRRDLA